MVCFFARKLSDWVPGDRCFCLQWRMLRSFWRQSLSCSRGESQGQIVTKIHALCVRIASSVLVLKHCQAMNMFPTVALSLNIEDDWNRKAYEMPHLLNSCGLRTFVGLDGPRWTPHLSSVDVSLFRAHLRTREILAQPGGIWTLGRDKVCTRSIVIFAQDETPLSLIIKPDSRTLSPEACCWSPEILNLPYNSHHSHWL